MTQDAVGYFHPSHFAELFDTTEALVDTVSGFVRDGLNQGDAALVIMRLAQWNSVSSELTRRNVPLSGAIANGQLTVLDGARTLGRIMLHGTPCRGHFDEVISKTVRESCAGGLRLRVYSDMVDILAAEGNFHAAHELEKLWGDVARHEPVTVLCGYSAATFYNPDAADTLRSICRSHSNVLENSMPLVPPVTARLRRHT
ncbi:MAG: MEDS domain-containing protein [Vicinamibacterales bacterium]